MKYVSPLYLLVISIAWAWLKLPEYLGVIAKDVIVQLSIGFIVLVAVFNLFVTAQSVARWEKEEKLAAGEDVAEGEI